ncbi:hypothetical protein [Owenweeksia hongkongensis]|uniref:hypothetical protein n=1 Tax=Owenweeksia hongkongensis TaxID=253245 RepID=UPI003A8C90EA
MEVFIRKFMSFVAIVCLYFVVNAVINLLIIESTEPEVKNTSLLIMGDSRVKKAIDPKLLPDAQNIAQLAEPYYITYWKLKELLPLIEPNTLMLGFGAHNISSFNDYKLIDGKWSAEMFTRTYSLNPLYHFDALPVDYKALCKVVWQQTCVYPKLSHYKYIGKYDNIDYSKISDADESIQRHYYRADTLLTVSEVSVSYLDSIIDLTKENRVELILINVPVHSSYRKKIPQNFIDNYLDLSSKLVESGVSIISEDSNYPDNLFLNSDHLNKNGAQRFTRELRVALARVK